MSAVYVVFLSPAVIIPLALVLTLELSGKVVGVMGAMAGAFLPASGETWLVSYRLAVSRRNWSNRLCWVAAPSSREPKNEDPP